jgi:hypothetical protein
MKPGPAMRNPFRQPAGSTEAADTRVERPPGKLEKLLVPASVLRQTITGLSLSAPREGLAYWIGADLQDGRAIVSTVAFPRVAATYDHFQVLEGQMGLVTTWCAERSLWVLGQVHSHPTDEPHSEADETWPASSRAGFLSVVFPFFAQHSDVRTPQWRVYEAKANAEWAQIDPDERLVVVPDVWLPPR